MKPLDEKEIQISRLAQLKLKWLLTQEQAASSDLLVFRVVPLTSGCNTPSFALELTEFDKDRPWIVVNEIPFLYDQTNREWMKGLIIDLNRDTGNFSIYHPHPPQIGGCSFPT